MKNNYTLEEQTMVLNPIDKEGQGSETIDDGTGGDGGNDGGDK